MNILERIEKRLLELKQDLDSLNEAIVRNEDESNELKPQVNQFKKLSQERAALKTSRREMIEQLDVISEFIKEATGEVSYGLYPLFHKDAQQVQPVAEQFNSIN